jgi:hypothetical protein
MNTWRENFEGVEFKHKETGFTISGAVDDIWVNPEGELIVVDYKATSKEGTIATLDDSSWKDSYARQMGVYQWLLRNNGFTVSPLGYFVYANAKSDKAAFDGELEFEVTLVPCEGDTAWIDEILPKIKAALDSDEIPPTGAACEFCPYREAAGKKLLELHKKGPSHLRALMVYAATRMECLSKYACASGSLMRWRTPSKQMCVYVLPASSSAAC